MNQPHRDRGRLRQSFWPSLLRPRLLLMHVPAKLPKPEPLPSSVETWLIDPLSAPDFSLPDLAGKTWELRSFRGGFLLLNFWTTTSPSCVRAAAASPAATSRTSHPAGFASLASTWTSQRRDCDPALCSHSSAKAESSPFPSCSPHRMWRASTTSFIATCSIAAGTCALPTSFLLDQGRHDRKGLPGAGESPNGCWKM